MNHNIRIVGMHGCAGIPLTAINAYSALSIPAYKRAMAFISENLASFPRSVRLNGAKLKDSHPLDPLLKLRPNGYQNATQFWRTLFFHAAHTGNGYARIERQSTRPIGLHNMLPEDILPFRVDAADGSGIEQWYLHRPTRTVYHGGDILHIQGGLSHDGMASMDPVALQEMTFQRAATLERYQVEYLRKGTVIRGAVEIAGHLTPEQLQEFRAVLRTFRGSQGDDDVLILTEGAKLSNVTTSPQQSQLVEQVAATTKEIAQATGVPPEFLYELSEAKYNASVEQAGQSVVRYTFRTWIDMAEDELTIKLLTADEQDRGYTIGINPDSLLKGDTAAVADSAIKTVNAGLRTRNEGRDLLGLPPDPDPRSNELRTLGDTTPQPSPTPASSGS